MKVAVVTSSPPLAEGGHLVIARSVVDALREAGHDAGLMRHAAEPFRAAGVGVPGHLAHRRRRGARRDARSIT